MSTRRFLAKNEGKKRLLPGRARIHQVVAHSARWLTRTFRLDASSRADWLAHSQGFPGRLIWPSREGDGIRSQLR